MVIEIFDVVVISHVIRCPVDKDYWRVLVRIFMFNIVIVPWPKMTRDSDDAVGRRVVTWIATITF